MTNAKRDENSVKTLIAADASNGITIDLIYADPSTHHLKVADAATGTDHGPTNAPRDENMVPVLMAVSSADGVTPVVVYADGSGNLLVKSS